MLRVSPTLSVVPSLYLNVIPVNHFVSSSLNPLPWCFLLKNSLDSPYVIPKKGGGPTPQRKGLEKRNGACSYEAPPSGGLQYMLFRYSEALYRAIALRGDRHWPIQRNP